LDEPGDHCTLVHDAADVERSLAISPFGWESCGVARSVRTSGGDLRREPDGRARTWTPQLGPVASAALSLQRRAGNSAVTQWLGRHTDTSLQREVVRGGDGKATDVKFTVGDEITLKLAELAQSLAASVALSSARGGALVDLRREALKDAGITDDERTFLATVLDPLVQSLAGAALESASLLSLRREALKDETVSDDERMFLAGMLDPANAERVRTEHIAKGTSFSFPKDSVGAHLGQVKDSGARSSIPRCAICWQTPMTTSAMSSAAPPISRRPSPRRSSSFTRLRRRRGAHSSRRRLRCRVCTPPRC
jgi:hypothetical protein